MSDGTEAGTVLIKDIVPGYTSSSLRMRGVGHGMARRISSNNVVGWPQKLAMVLLAEMPPSIRDGAPTSLFEIPPLPPSP